MQTIISKGGVINMEYNINEISNLALNLLPELRIEFYENHEKIYQFGKEGEFEIIQNIGESLCYILNYSKDYFENGDYFDIKNSNFFNLSLIKEWIHCEEQIKTVNDIYIGCADLYLKYNPDFSEASLLFSGIIPQKYMANIENTLFNNQEYGVGYICYSLGNIISSSLDYIICNNLNLKKCHACGKFYIAKKSDRMYCDNLCVLPQYKNKTCRQAMRLVKQLEREHSNISQKLYKTIYNRLRNRTSSKHENKVKKAEEEWHTFCNEANIYKLAIKEHRISDKEYMNWLKKVEKETK